jgi:hypothetical protein
LACGTGCRTAGAVAGRGETNTGRSMVGEPPNAGEHPTGPQSAPDRVGAVATASVPHTNHSQCESFRMQGLLRRRVTTGLRVADTRGRPALRPGDRRDEIARQGCGPSSRASGRNLAEAPPDEKSRFNAGGQNAQIYNASLQLQPGTEPPHIYC